MMGTGIRSRSPPMSKFCSDLCVCAPHSLQDTYIQPRKAPPINRSIKTNHGIRHEQIETPPSNPCGRREKPKPHALVVGDSDGAEGVALLAEAGGDRASQRRAEQQRGRGRCRRRRRGATGGRAREAPQDHRHLVRRLSLSLPPTRRCRTAAREAAAGECGERSQREKGRQVGGRRRGEEENALRL